MQTEASLTTNDMRSQSSARPPQTRSHHPPVPRRLPVGAEPHADGTHFRVWAPKAKDLKLALVESNQAAPVLISMHREENGYYSVEVPQARPGMRYGFQFGEKIIPDPVSRFQPEGPHGLSQIIDPHKFSWNDDSWLGVRREGQVIYEMHIGTFTREGTFAAAADQLNELAALGITMIEVMPVAEFPGRFGWGYDGVNLFAPTRLYGAPDDFRAFVDRAHAAGLGVILDVVYNHFGPDGNYLRLFSDDYFSERYKNEWGDALNFDDPQAGPCREFFLSNAVYWIEEFHLDGLRLDATQQIFDQSPTHILTEISRAVRGAAQGRGTFIVAENESQHSEIARPDTEGGYGIDALWNDDFHHSVRVALTGKNEAYYTDYKGSPQEFISAFKYGYLYQGQWYAWQKQPRGRTTKNLHPSQFVTYIQNHDQVANSLRGARLHQMSSPALVRAITAAFLLGPSTPMLFQGQEFGSSKPFYYFADHHPELSRLVHQGRRTFLEQFPSICTEDARRLIVDPSSPELFEASKLDLDERKKNRGIYQLHRDLLRVRREDPLIGHAQPGGMDGAVLADRCFLLRYFSEDDRDRLLIVNLGEDLHLSPCPEPLIAPPRGMEWDLTISTENPDYDGMGTPCLRVEGRWRIPGQCALFFNSVEKKEPHGKVDSSH